MYNESWPAIYGAKMTRNDRRPETTGGSRTLLIAHKVCGTNLMWVHNLALKIVEYQQIMVT